MSKERTREAATRRDGKRESTVAQRESRLCKSKIPVKNPHRLSSRFSHCFHRSSPFYRSFFSFDRSYSILASDVRVEELSASLPNRVRHRRTRKIACGSILEQFPVNRNDVDRLVLEYRGRRGRARRRFSSDKIDGTVN